MFHFHRPSEERLNGKRYPMVAQLWNNLPREKEREVSVDKVEINGSS